MGKTKEMLALFDIKRDECVNAVKALKHEQENVAGQEERLYKGKEQMVAEAKRKYDKACKKIDELIKDLLGKIDRTALNECANNVDVAKAGLKEQLQEVYSLHNISHEQLCGMLSKFSGVKHKPLKITGDMEWDTMCGMMYPAGLVMVKEGDRNFDSDEYRKTRGVAVKNSDTVKIIYACMTTHPDEMENAVVEKWNWWQYYVYARNRESGLRVECPGYSRYFGDFYDANGEFSKFISTVIDTLVNEGYFDNLGNQGSLDGQDNLGNQDNLDDCENALND